MRDQHKRKDDLLQENARLRQQVIDLKDEAKARQRVDYHLRETVTRYAALFDRAPWGVALFDRDGRVALANRALARALGYRSGAELVSLAAVVPLIEERAWNEMARRIPEEGGFARATVRLRTKDGEAVALELDVASADDAAGGGGVVAFVGELRGAAGRRGSGAVGKSDTSGAQGIQMGTSEQP